MTDLEAAARELYALAPEDFVAERTRLVKQARAAKDWSRADALRDKLTGAGVVVEDSPSGARWHLA